MSKEHVFYKAEIDMTKIFCLQLEWINYNPLVNPNNA